MQGPSDCTYTLRWHDIAFLPQILCVGRAAALRPEGPAVHRPPQSGRSLAREKTSAEGAAPTVIQEDRPKTNKASVAPSALIHVCDLIPASRPGLCTVGPSGLSQDSGLPANMSYAQLQTATYPVAFTGLKYYLLRTLQISETCWTREYPPLRRRQDTLDGRPRARVVLYS